MSFWGRIFGLIGFCSLLLSGVFAAEGFVYEDHGKRDPFWRLVTPSGAITSYDTDLTIGDLVLEGIIFDSSGPGLAIINGKIFRIDEQVGPYRVQKITADQVFLTKEQENFILQLKKEE